MEHLSRTQFEALPEKEREWQEYEMTCENHRLLKEHDIAIKRFYGYENAGKISGKFLMRLFFLAMGASMVVWFTNHFGK